MRSRVHGSIAIEGCVAIAAFAIVVPFLVDGVKRSQYQLVLQRAAFVFVRLRTLGVSQSEAKRDVLRYLRAAFVNSDYEISDSVTGSGRWGAVHLRFEMSETFRVNGVLRHHLEVTERCLFPF